MVHDGPWQRELGPSHLEMSPEGEDDSADQDHSGEPGDGAAPQPDDGGQAEDCQRHPDVDAAVEEPDVPEGGDQL